MVRFISYFWPTIFARPNMSQAHLLWNPRPPVITYIKFMLSMLAFRPYCHQLNYCAETINSQHEEICWMSKSMWLNSANDTHHLQSILCNYIDICNEWFRCLARLEIPRASAHLCTSGSRPTRYKSISVLYRAPCDGMLHGKNDLHVHVQLCTLHLY